MQGLDNYYNGLLAEHQRSIDEAAEREEQEEFKPTAEDLAFVESYATCVAVGSREDVLKFLSILDPDKNTVMPDYIFTSIEDAWLVWQDAMKFAKEVCK
jgi:hypothetical protein